MKDIMLRYRYNNDFSSIGFINVMDGVFIKKERAYWWPFADLRLCLLNLDNC